MGGAIALDQVTKAIVRAKLDFGELWPGDWPVRITRVNNTGSAFGLFDGQTLFLIIASILAIGFMIYFYRQMAGAGWLLRLSMGLQLGGAASNLADRIRDGEVTDFIEFPHWPVFNAADSSVVIGILLLAWCVLFMERGHAKT
jgi:signal peptidase II